MRCLALIIAFLLTGVYASAQRIVYNDKAPKLEADSLIIGSAPTKGKPLFLDFFVYGAKQNLEEFTALNSMAEKFSDKIDFVVVTKENSAQSMEFFESLGEIFFTIVHDVEGRTFSSYNVKFIPFAVIVDKKDNFVWQGRSSKLTEQIILEYTQ